jgi:hypothetical protein
MSIRFPQSCRTRAERSERARLAARARWQREHDGGPAAETCIGYIEFGGALAGGRPMRLELVARDGKRKWEGRAEGTVIGDFSERRVLNLVRNVLRMPRYE